MRLNQLIQGAPRVSANQTLFVPSLNGLIVVGDSVAIVMVSRGWPLHPSQAEVTKVQMLCRIIHTCAPHFRAQDEVTFFGTTNSMLLFRNIGKGRRGC